MSADDKQKTDIAIQAGIYEVEYCEILLANREAFDVTKQIETINIYEDMHGPFMLGKLTLRDTYDLPQFFHRGGKDLLRISIKTNGLKDDDKNRIKGLFHIYRFGDREMIKDRNQEYSFFFRSIESMFDFHTSVSRLFSGTSDAIVGEIIQKYYIGTTKKYNSKPSAHVHRFVSNFWIPLKCIEYACQLAKHDRNDAAYLFYENRYGFNFQLIQDIIKDEKPKLMQIFQDSDFSVDIATDVGALNFGEAGRNAERDYRIVQRVKVKTLYDVIETYNHGGLTSKMTLYDMLKKTIAVNTKNSSINPLLNRYPLWPGDLTGTLQPKRFTVNKHYDVTDKANSTNLNFIQGQLLEKRVLNSLTIEIDVFGRTDYTVGKVIRFDSIKKANLNKEESFDEMKDIVYGGYYIVSAINHQFTRIGHYCTIELSRESGLQE